MLTHLRYKPSSASSETVGGAASNAVDGVATIVHEVKKTCFTKQLRRNVCQLFTNCNISGSKVHRNEKRAVAVVDGGSALCTGETVVDGDDGDHGDHGTDGDDGDDGTDGDDGDNGGDRWIRSLYS